MKLSVISDHISDRPEEAFPVIRDAGYQTTVIMAVTNSADYPQMKKKPDQTVAASETPVLTF